MMRCLTGERSLSRSPAVGPTATGSRVRAMPAGPAQVVEWARKPARSDLERSVMITGSREMPARSLGVQKASGAYVAISPESQSKGGAICTCG